MTNILTTIPWSGETVSAVTPKIINDNCTHTFPIWMVVPPQGCTINCPTCGKPTFIQGTQITC